MTDLYVPGTVVLNAAAAPGGGNGPGTYAYPTATNSDGSPTFAPGLVPADRAHGDRLRLAPSRSRSASRTCSPRSARCSARSSSTCTSTRRRAACPRVRRSRPRRRARSTTRSRPADAWNQLIEVDGFGTDDWVTPGSATLRAGRFVQRWAARRSRWPSSARPASAHAGPGHDHRAHVRARHARLGLDVHGHADRPGRLRHRRRPHVHRHPGQLHVRGLLGRRGGRGVAARGLLGQPGARSRSCMDTIPPAAVNVQTELDPTAEPVRGGPAGSHRAIAARAAAGPQRLRILDQ